MPCEPMTSEHVEMDIADSDNFPDGSYEVTVAGRTIPLTRRDGFYLAGQASRVPGITGCGMGQHREGFASAFASRLQSSTASLRSHSNG